MIGSLSDSSKTGIWVWCRECTPPLWGSNWGYYCILCRRTPLSYRRDHPKRHHCRCKVRSHHFHTNSSCICLRLGSIRLCRSSFHRSAHSAGRKRSPCIHFYLLRHTDSREGWHTARSSKANPWIANNGILRRGFGRGRWWDWSRDRGLGIAMSACRILKIGSKRSRRYWLQSMIYRAVLRT
jgi:hypothetical protein